uniref:Uncharacterized protein n=1 Tax=Ditylenchus dipsaci TaxID=166011 RepID=A0A915EK28_9BILA
MAELAFDLVTPDYAYQRQRRIAHDASAQRVKVAGDIREGLTMAYDTLREGVMDTAQTLQAAAQQDRAHGSQWVSEDFFDMLLPPPFDQL